MQRIVLPAPFRAQILDAAQRAFPLECCGLIEGVVTAGGWSALALHETRNLADDPRRHFLIDPQVQFALLRHLRGSERGVIGCFHSHPGGPAVPSEHDRGEAAEDGFVWIVAGGAPDRGYILGATVFETTQRRFVPIEIM